MRTQVYALGDAREPALVALVDGNGDRVTTTAVQLAPLGGDVATTASTRGADERIAAIELPLNRVAPEIPDETFPGACRLELLDAEGDVLDSLELASLAVQRPLLRVRAGSISHEPRNPTDGDTIWISFEIENAGNALSMPALPRLYGRDPSLRPEPLPVQSLNTPEGVPALGPGRTRAVRLRWDPIENAGKQTIWIDLNSNVRDEAARRQQRSSYSFLVHSKSDPRIVRGLRVVRSTEERVEGSATLEVVIANLGETDSRPLEVVFYRTRDYREEDVIGRVTIDRLEAGEERPIRQYWPDYDPETVPGVELRLIGSKQRITDEEAAEVMGGGGQ